MYSRKKCLQACEDTLHDRKDDRAISEPHTVSRQLWRKRRKSNAAWNQLTGLQSQEWLGQ